MPLGPAQELTDDQQTYGRASSAALLGLGTQLVFVIIVAGMGLYGQSRSFHAATWYLIGGLPIWMMLWLLYNQHRLERVEALEAEQLAQEDARAAALFDEAGHNLATARKRLGNFYKWGLNAVSIAVAVYLVGVGLILFFSNWNLIDTVDGAKDYRRLFDGAMGNPFTNPWMLVGFTALLSFLGFLVARYIAGMTRVESWQLLRGGAAYLIGNVLAIMLLGIAVVFAVVTKSNGVLASLALIIPVLMIVLGIETLLAFIFGIYRPRKANEVVRPAFDSRLLGWLTSPESLGKIVSETLNYQFGFEITKSWFYVLLGRALTPLILAGVLILIGLTSIVIVAPNQKAVITSRGELVRIADPGVSFKMPWPIGRAKKVDVERSQQIVIGAYEESKRIPGMAMLWTSAHIEGKEEYFATAPTVIDDPSIRQSVEQELQGLESFDGDDPLEAGTSRLGSLVSLQAIVTYNIGDLEAYVSENAPSRPEQLLAAIAQRHLNAIVGTQQIDNLIGSGRIEIGQELLELIRNDVSAYGINVQNVSLYDVHPPREGEVAAAFLQQVNALQSQKTAIENAQRDAIGILSSAAGSRAEALRAEKAIQELTKLRQQRQAEENSDELDQEILEQETRINRLIDQAGGEAARILADARQERWKVALVENSESSRFAFELAAFNLAPDYFKSRHYLNAIAESFGQSNRRVISTVPITDDSTIRLNLEEANTATEFFNPE